MRQSHVGMRSLLTVKVLGCSASTVPRFQRLLEHRRRFEPAPAAEGQHILGDTFTNDDPTRSVIPWVVLV